jgi:hypothetical protein
LRGCDLVGLKVRDVCHVHQVAAGAIVLQHKIQRSALLLRQVRVRVIDGHLRDGFARWYPGFPTNESSSPNHLNRCPHHFDRSQARESQQLKCLARSSTWQRLA